MYLISIFSDQFLKKKLHGHNYKNRRLFVERYVGISHWNHVTVASVLSLNTKKFCLFFQWKKVGSFLLMTMSFLTQVLSYGRLIHSKPIETRDWKCLVYVGTCCFIRAYVNNSISSIRLGHIFLQQNKPDFPRENVVLTVAS